MSDPEEEALEMELALGWDAFGSGRLETARVHFRRVREQAPRTALAADAAYLEVLSLRRAGDAGEAATVIEALLASDPDLPRRDEFLLAKAELQLERGEAESAMVLLERLASSPIANVRKKAEAKLGTRRNGP